MNRILWNRRPGVEFDPGDIDEVVITDCAVHIEQLSKDSSGVTWDSDETHEEAS